MQTGTAGGGDADDRGAPDDHADVGSVTRWVADLKAGDAEAAALLWGRYFPRLVSVARRRLGAKGRASGEADEEDAALSAFAGFCDALARGRFEKLGDREDLWRLLVVITARKVNAQADRRRALKRGGAANQIDPAANRTEPAGDALDLLPGAEPTPEFSALVAEEYDRLLERLGDDEVRKIAVWRLEGYTADEIAERLGCARRTVARRLDLIRKVWSEEAS